MEKDDCWAVLGYLCEGQPKACKPTATKKELFDAIVLHMRRDRALAPQPGPEHMGVQHASASYRQCRSGLHCPGFNWLCVWGLATVVARDNDYQTMTTRQCKPVTASFLQWKDAQ